MLFSIKKADYVLITNNDVKADQKLISALMHTAQKDVKKTVFVTGKVLYL
jgi:cytosine/adenosine deaminase-related metal-dependent hydrolase